MLIALLILIVSVIVYLIITVILDDAIPKDYEYCHDCNQGFCTETPKSKDCLKWQEELHEQRRMDSDLFNDIRK